MIKEFIAKNIARFYFYNVVYNSVMFKRVNVLIKTCRVLKYPAINRLRPLREGRGGRGKDSHLLHFLPLTPVTH